jgi:5-formyltetrahydrofolate cyclo-ligase
MLEPGCALSDLDPELYRTILVRAKRQLRKRMSALRQAIPGEALAVRNRHLCERVLGAGSFAAARSIGLFWPILERHEVDLREVDARARALSKQVFYPFMTDTGSSVRTGFRRVQDISTLCDRGRGFLEPADSAPEASRGDLDLILVPALAATPEGQRLGYGAGFYDVTLPDFCPPGRSVIVAFDFQLLGELPISELDVACSAVITDVRQFGSTEPER